MYAGHRIAAILPALDEEESSARVLGAIDRGLVDRVIVADNGSTDRTAAVAREAGAEVVHEERRGYGSACLRALAGLENETVLVLLDADGSDDPRQIQLLLAALTSGQADLVIGSRVSGRAEPGAFLALQRHDLVLGPALDGGYYLIGMRGFHPESFQGIDGGSSRVMEQTVARARAAQLDLMRLAPLADIDRPEDLVHLPPEFAPGPRPAKRGDA